MMEAMRFGFMRHALAAGLLVSIACGIVGTLIVVKRLVFVSGGIAHAAYGGIGLGYLLGINPVVGAIGFSLVAALGMGAIQRKTGERADTLIGVTWAIGMALGVVFVDLSRGYKADLMSYLFGSILAVPAGDLLLMLILDIVIVLLVVLFYKELLAVTFDEVFATVERVPVAAIYLLLMGMIGLTVVMLMRVVGLILVIAMLTIPAAVSGQFVRDLKRTMVLAIGLGAVFVTVGLWLSYFLNLTSGAAIILLSGTAYLASLALHALAQRRQAAGRPHTP
ncbi:MAG: metal ABC transporter permease [Anaerolineae bacterium]